MRALIFRRMRKKCDQIFLSFLSFEGSGAVRGWHHSGCLKRSQATMAGGKLFEKSFPPFRNFWGVTALPASAGTAAKKSLEGGLGENLSSERFPPAQPTRQRLEPRFLITPHTKGRAAFRLPAGRHGLVPSQRAGRVRTARSPARGTEPWRPRGGS